jgi:tetratricopeptide (TPR) repeat protein
MTIATLLLRANRAERQNKLEEAERLYTEVAERAPRNFDGLHGRGVICYRKGDLENAERWIRKAIKVNPTSGHARNNLGSVALASGNVHLAVDFYRSAIAVAPSFVDARNNLAAALSQLGDLAEAQRQYEITLRIAPDHVEANNNLGAVLQRTGRDGVAYFEKALAANPDFPDALNNLGTALLGHGNLERAVELCSRAIELRPGFSEGHNSLGNALARRGEYEKAIYHYGKAISLRPNFAEAHNNLGTALDSVDRVDQALACFEKAAELDPTYADPHANLAAIRLRYGMLDDAKREFERSVDLAPTNAKFLLYLAELKRFAAGDPHIEILERMSSDPTLQDPEQKLGVHFALAKAYADVDDHQGAAQHMVKANSLKRLRVTYDETASLNELRLTQELFTGDLMRRYAEVGNTSDTPIFIVGMPRSGTTLIEQILASHESVFGADELRHFSDGVTRLPSQMGSKQEYPEFAPIMTQEWLTRLADDYLRAIRTIAPNASRITDKMPGNFRFVGLIHLVFPNARIIHARRDPVDNCLSCYSILFTEGQAFTYDLRELARLYKGYEGLMAHWHAVLPRGVMIDVQYENLVADFENEARRILAHCNLDWSPACLDFHKTHRAVRTASATQVRKPLYSTAVGRWRPYAKMLQPLLDELGLHE